MLPLMHQVGAKTVKVSAKVPVSQERALKQMAKDNERSMAAEMRIALHNHLKKDGRIL
jgi:hypothetical protein